MKSVTTEGEVKPDRTVTVRMPRDFPPGPVRVTVTERSAEPAKIRTFGDLLSNEFFGMFEDRDDLPKTDEEFCAWRNRLWETRI